MRALSAGLIFLTSCATWAVDRGINYDPAHSQAYTSAQLSNNLEGMKQQVKLDMTTAQQAGFRIVKTFYSLLSTVDGKKETTMADIICPMGMQMMLGVYEFDPGKDNCSNWCDIAREKQVKAAISSVQKYNTGGKKCIIGIAIGNEDIYNWNFTSPNTHVQKNLAADLGTIKAALGDLVPVGTVQQDGALLQLAKKDPYGIIPKLDYIGANIYPYWSAEKPDVTAAHQEFTNRYEAIKNQFTGKEIIVGEEGWPSQFSAGQNPNASLASAKDYYAWWQGRADDFDSYYFGLFDKQPSNGDADKFFGLCTYDRKDKVITNCD